MNEAGIETWEQVDTFNLQMRHLFGQQRLTEAEQIIVDQLRGGGSAIGGTCAGIALERVQVTGWTDLVADMAKIDARGPACTAVCIDLSGHEDGDSPLLETSFYDDGPLQFSKLDAAAISRVALSGTKPWQGDFLDITRCLRVEGLHEPLRFISSYGARHASGQLPLPAHYSEFLLTNWFNYLRLSQAIARDVEAYGLPRTMPIVVGQHDFGPDFTFVHIVELIRDDRSAVDTVLEDRDAEARRGFFEHIEKEIEHYRNGRELVKSFGRPFLTESQKLNLDVRESSERYALQRLGVEFEKATFRMSDREFENFVVRFSEGWKRNSVAGKQLFPNLNTIAENVSARSPASRRPPFSFGRKIR